MNNITLKDLIKTLTTEQRKDKEIQKYILQYGYRASTGEYFQYFNGNGIIEFNKNNGTLITTVLTDDEFDAEFPVNMDVNISNCCTNNCKFCYQGCTPKGKNADLLGFIRSYFFKSIRPGTELALNGNDPFHKDLGVFLAACKEKEIMANLTVRYNTFCKNKALLKSWQDDGLIHGIGISVEDNMNFDNFKDYQNIVFHTINGITDKKIFDVLKTFKCKILILGYKDFGFGASYKNSKTKNIEINKKYLENNIANWVLESQNGKGFSVMSFDNLALEQLKVQDILSDEDWRQFYRGADGHHTQYIDLVDMTFCKNSTVPKKMRYNLDTNGDIIPVFTRIKLDE